MWVAPWLINSDVRSFFLFVRYELCHEPVSSGGQALDNVAQEGSESKIEEDDSDASVWSQLYAVDPEAANRLHPKDTRRIRRALQVCPTPHCVRYKSIRETSVIR